MLAEILLILLPGMAAVALHSRLFGSTSPKRILGLWLVYGCIINVCVYWLRWVWTNEPLGFLGENFRTNREFVLYGFAEVLLVGVLPVSRYLLTGTTLSGNRFGQRWFGGLKIVWVEVVVDATVLTWTHFNQSLNFHQIELGWNLETLFFLFAKIGIVAAIHFLIKGIRRWFIEFPENKTYLILLLLNTVVLLVITLVFFSNGIIGSQLHSDMSAIRKMIQNFKWCFYQGWYANVFYMIAFMLFPPAFVNIGLVLLQMAALVLVFTHIQYFVYKEFGKQVLILAVFVCLLPANLFFSQFTLRTSWLAYTIAILITLWYPVLYDKKPCSKYDMLKLLLVSAFAATLRGESLYLVPIVIAALIVHYRKVKYIAASVSVFLVGVLLLKAPQVDSPEYRTTPFLNPLSNMVADEGLKFWDEGEDINNINAIINIDALKRNASTTDLKVVHRERDAWNVNNTDEEYRDFVITYVRLVAKNPLIWFKARWKTFWLTNSNDAVLGYRYLLNRMGVNSIGLNMVSFIFYNSLLPLLLSTILTIILAIRRKRWFRDLLMLGFVAGEAMQMFAFQTQIEYMFHFIFWFPAWILCVILFGRIIKEPREL